jgi:hypothetical protein
MAAMGWQMVEGLKSSAEKFVLDIFTHILYSCGQSSREGTVQTPTLEIYW